MRRTALLLALLAFALPAAVARAAVAPGRVVLGPSTARVPEADPDAVGAFAAVASPDGGAVLAGGRRTTQLRAITRTGAPVAGFGQRGVAQDVGPAGFLPEQLLRRPDGRLLLVGASGASAPERTGALTVVALTATGARDATFGVQGVVRTGLDVSCANCAPASLQPDGTLLLAGTAPAASGQPKAGAVVRLGVTGAPDLAFGTSGTARAGGAGAFAVAPAPAGRLLVLVAREGGAQVVALSAAGAADASYASPALTVVLGDQLVVDPAGRATVVGSDAALRLLADGTPDPAFGVGGAVAYPIATPGGFPPLVVPASDGGLLLAFRSTLDAGRLDTTPALRVVRLAATGALSPVVDVQPGFGGGLATSVSSPRLTPGLGQDSFAPGALVARPDGSLLVAGGVGVVQDTGEGAGRSAGYVAAASLTAGLQADSGFGGPTSARPTFAVGVPAQHARSDVALGRVLLRVRASGPGLVELRVRDGRRRVLAQALRPVYAAGSSTVRLPLTAFGRRELARGSLRVRVGRAGTDLLGRRAATGSRVARLR